MRRLDWPERLAQALAEAQSRTFSEVDYCVLFAADCIEAMTGEDPAADYRGLSLEDAQEKFKAEDTTTYRRLTQIFGKAIPLAFARRGDLIVRTKPEFALGICDGQHTAFLSSEGGLAFLPTLSLRWAFRVQ